MRFRISRLQALVTFITMAGLSAQAASDWITPSVRATQVEQRFFDSAAAKTKVSFFIYTPESYDAEKERRFPVLYWLHGTTG